MLHLSTYECVASPRRCIAHRCSPLLADRMEIGRAAIAWKSLHACDHAWLRDFCQATFGDASPNTRSYVRRAMDVSQRRGVMGHVGRGRHNTNRCTRVKPAHRKRRWGAGRRVCCPAVGYELFQWLVDSLDSKARINCHMLTHQALIIKQDLMEQYAKDGVQHTLPAITSS